MKIILGKKEDLSSQLKYQVYSMMIMFKKKTSDLLRHSFSNPLRNVPQGSSDYHWKLQAVLDDAEDILNLCLKYFLFAKELQVFHIDSSELLVPFMHVFHIKNFLLLSIFPLNLCTRISFLFWPPH